MVDRYAQGFMDIMGKCGDGDYVSYEDYKKLEEENKKLKERITELEYDLYT